MSEKSIKYIRNCLDLFYEPNRSACLRLLSENEKLFELSPGSSKKHHFWPGGYSDHVADTFRLSYEIYDGLKKFENDYSRNNPDISVTQNDIILVLFLHDLEKPWKYVNGLKFANKAERHHFRLNKAEEYGILLSDNHINAIKYAEGEGNDYSPTERIMNPLAAIVHTCDVISARVYY